MSVPPRPRHRPGTWLVPKNVEWMNERSYLLSELYVRRLSCCDQNSVDSSPKPRQNKSQVCSQATNKNTGPMLLINVCHWSPQGYHGVKMTSHSPLYWLPETGLISLSCLDSLLPFLPGCPDRLLLWVDPINSAPKETLGEGLSKG